MNALRVYGIGLILDYPSSFSFENIGVS